MTGFTYGTHAVVLFRLHILNKNENTINAEYWVLSENRKN